MLGKQPVSPRAKVQGGFQNKNKVKIDRSKYTRAVLNLGKAEGRMRSCIACRDGIPTSLGRVTPDPATPAAPVQHEERRRHWSASSAPNHKARRLRTDYLLTSAAAGSYSALPRIPR
jgi:hypothetical protein